MRLTLAPLLACLLIATSMAATAQTAEAEAESETPAEEAGGLSMGEPDTAEPQVGQTYVAETFTDWELRCVRTEDGNEPCQLYQLLRDLEGNAVAEITLVDLQDGGQAVAGATVVTPLETLLTAELRLAVDGGQARRYPYSYCNTIGCFARIGFTETEIETLKRGANAIVSIVPALAPTETVEVAVSLSGFTAGWNAMVERSSR